MTSIARRAYLAGMLALTLAGVLSHAGAVSSEKGFVFIVNKANPVISLKRTQIIPIFMGRVSRWPFGAEIVAIDCLKRLPPGSLS